jgi:beta-lactam-binding protein with PASTA domain
MRRSFPLAALTLLASGCLGGGGGAAAIHAPRHMVSVPDVVHPAGEPDAIGVSADAAGTALHRAQLRLSIRRPFLVSSFWGRPLVMSQSLAAGVRVPAGTPVTITVRQEPGPSICVAHRHVVSDVVGETLTRAEQELPVALSATLPPLPPSRVTRWENAYRVTSQSSPAGTRAAPCTSIRLRVRPAVPSGS